MVTVELEAEGDAALLSWTEQAVFVSTASDPSHDLAHLRGGARLRLNGLTATVGRIA
ncbi:hypothetical protein [Nocardia sp. NPDC052112]|uniref:hypothetical protein n=1 Tax=Nocardia sp. NPDC052112 TaxID=3155646 RepID=UPI00343FA3BC